MSDPLELRGVTRTYRSAGGDLPVLTGVNLCVAAGEIVALVAPSGTGKSTLLHLAGLLEQPDQGRVLISGQDGGALSDRARTAIRRDAVGFVYQRGAYLYLAAIQHYFIKIPCTQRVFMELNHSSALISLVNILVLESNIFISAVNENS
jgi:ABC-type lipoprotein export system ATPase subunit